MVHVPAPDALPRTTDRRPEIPPNPHRSRYQPPTEAASSCLEAWDRAWERDWLRAHAYDNETIVEHAYGVGVISHAEYLAATHEAFLARVDAVLLESVRDTLTVGEALEVVRRKGVDELAERRAA